MIVVLLIFCVSKYNFYLVVLTTLPAVFKAQQAPKTSKKKNVKRDAGEENPEDYVDPETPFGEKKQLSSQMAKQYNPDTVENS